MLYIEGVAYHNLRRILIRLVIQTIRTPEIRNIAFRRHPGSAKKTILWLSSIISCNFKTFPDPSFHPPFLFLYYRKRASS